MQDLRPAVEKAKTVAVGQPASPIHHPVEVAVPLVLPAPGKSYGLGHVGRGSPTLFRGLVQVASSQVVPALRQEVSSLGNVALNVVRVIRAHVTIVR